MVPGNEGGRSQPHLFSADDGNDYMVKRRNNPQGPRVAVNEVLGGLCLDWLGVKHPPSAVIDLPLDVVTDSPQARFNDGRELCDGPAFGSEYWQSDPDASVSPSLIINLDNVAATLVFDTWVKQFDSRQSRVRAAPHDPGKYDFFPVDQGHSFGGPDWSTASLTNDLKDVSVRMSALSLVREHFRPAIERLCQLSQEIADAIVTQVPQTWLSAAERTGLAHYLMTRAPLAVRALETAYP
jgi:hypothetical protein